MVSMVDNYTHFESLHKQHPDLAVQVFAEVERLREALDHFRITVALRTAKQQHFCEQVSIETNPPYEATAEEITPMPSAPPLDPEAPPDTQEAHTETQGQCSDPQEP